MMKLLALVVLGLSSGHALHPAEAVVRPRWTARRSPVLMASNPITEQWGKYMQALETHPMRTKMITGAVLSAAGDLIAQQLEGVPFFALRRLLNLVTVNVLFITFQD